MADHRTAASPWPTVDQLIDYAMDQADDAARCDLVQERVFLGGILCGPARPISLERPVPMRPIDRLYFMLGPADFFDPLHAAIWSACVRLRAEEDKPRSAPPGQKFFYAGELVFPGLVAAAVSKVPGAPARVEELERQYLDCEGEEAFLLKCIRLIRECAVQRGAAHRLADRRRTA